MMIWLCNGNTKRGIRNIPKVAAFGTHEITKIIIVKKTANCE